HSDPMAQNPSPAALRSLYRQLARAGSQASRGHQRYSKVFRTQLHRAFDHTPESVLSTTQSGSGNSAAAASPAKSATASAPSADLADQFARGQRTVDFLRLATRSDALEKKILFNMCFMRFHIDDYDARKHTQSFISNKRKSRNITELYHQYEATVQQLNESLGLALR
ncbi:hypothetical protein H4R33_005051, partial [Dimargaris cristalligena]